MIVLLWMYSERDIVYSPGREEKLLSSLECVLIDGARICISEVEREWEVALDGILPHQVYLVASLCIPHLHCHSRLNLHPIPIHEGHCPHVVVVAVVEEEGGSGGSGRVEGAHDAQFELHFLVSLYEFI